MDSILEFLKSICNLRDLLLIGFLLVSADLGTRRGLTRTLTGLLGRLAAMIVSSFIAKTAAPAVASALVTPIVGEIFERDALQYLGALAQPAQEAVTQMAVKMAESVAFLILFGFASVFLSLALRLVGQSLRFISKHSPLGLFDRLGGCVLGAAGGLLLLVIILLVLSYVYPALYQDLGFLSPVNTEHTRLTRDLLARLPVYR